MVGLKCWIGNEWKPNRGLSHRLVLILIHKAEQWITAADFPKEEHRWMVFLSHIVLTYVVALRDNE